MRKIISLFCFLLPILALAGQPEGASQIRSDAPDQHIVVKGDTLWDISGKFFKDPWKWPYIWGMNRDTIKNPHWIYPGQIVVLDRVHGTLNVGGAPETGIVTKLSPQVRSEASTQNAIPSISSSAIEPFLSQPLVVTDELTTDSPILVGLHDERVIVGPGDVVYAKGLTESQGKKWQVYRPGQTFIDPDTHEILGHEAVYLGTVEVRKFGDVSTAVVTDAKQEINVGDRLVVAAAETEHTYLPRAPAGQIKATVISIYGGVSQGGPGTIVTLNKGERDGLQNGHVLALFSKGRVVDYQGKNLTLPDVRYGLVFVFRVFQKVSYALVMETSLPVQLLDKANTP